MRFSRRTVLTLSLVTLFVLLLNVSQDSTVNAFRLPFLDNIVGRSFESVSLVVTYPFRKIKNFFQSYVALVGIKDENETLKKELSFERAHVLTLKERLKISLEQEVTGSHYERLGLKGVFARVVGYDPFARSQTIWVTAGKEDGVQVDQAVITLQGLVGRVIKVEGSVAQVLTLVDTHFAVDVLNEQSRVRALIVGSGRKVYLKKYPLMTHLEFLKLGDAMHSGDLFITSGLNGIYPEGIPVGNVIRVGSGDEEEQAILPLVDFSKLEQVFVVTQSSAFQGAQTP